MKVSYRFFLPMLLLHSMALSQGEQFVFGRNGYATLMPVYQRWTISDTSAFSQTAASIGVFVPLGRKWSVSLRTTAAGVSGDIPSLGGPGDTQVGVSYNIMEHNIVLNMSANLPSGKDRLTSDEFQTSIIVSKSVFDLYVPNYGQGAGVTIGGIWGIPLNEKVVVGIGASYSYLGTYNPLQQYDQKYDPGEELLLSGGLEWRASKSLDISFDAIFTTYGRDKLGEDEVYRAGNKLVANVQLKHYFGNDELWFFALYRSKAKSQYAIGGLFVTEINQFVPNEFELRSHFRHQFSTIFSGRVIVTGEFSGETADKYSDARIFGIGLAADIRVINDISIAPIMKYSFGTIKNDVRVNSVRPGIGISWDF